MTDDRDFSSYAAARWTHLVRCLVGVGVPLDAAHRSAAETLSHCHDAWTDRDEWVDLDVHVFRDLLDRWDRQRATWWEEPPPEADTEALVEAGWPEVEAELDRLGVPDRRALVLERVAALTSEQVQEVVGSVTGRRPDAALVDELVRALELVPVDPPRVEAMIEASERRRDRRRLASLAGGAALVVVAGVVTTLVLRHADPPAAERPEEFGPVSSLPYLNRSPVAWYAAGTLYLPHSQVELRDVRAFGQWDDGAVYLDLRGNLVAVTGDGERARIATLGPDSTFAVSDTTDRVVWVDPEGPVLVVYDLDTRQRRLELPLEEERTRVVSVEDDRAHLTVGAGLLAVDLTDGSREPVVDRRLPGELDRHGRHVLTREGGGAATARVRLYDTTTERPVPLAVDHPGSVVAARFGPDGSVVLLIDPPATEVSEARYCPPPYDECRLVTFFSSGGPRSILAQ